MSGPHSFLPDIYKRQMAEMLTKESVILNLMDTRTPDEKQAAIHSIAEKAAAIRSAHAENLAAASPLAAAILNLHAPVFSNENDAWPECHGCDGGGDYPPDFPCRTYDLAVAVEQR